MTAKGTFRVEGVAVLAFVLAITILHQIIPISQLHLHNFFQHVFYLPIVYSGLRFGWLAGLATAVFASLVNIPHNITTWEISPHYAIDQIWEIPPLCAAGIFSGVVAEK